MYKVYIAVHPNEEEENLMEIVNRFRSKMAQPTKVYIGAMLNMERNGYIFHFDKRSTALRFSIQLGHKKVKPILLDDINLFDTERLSELCVIKGMANGRFPI